MSSSCVKMLTEYLKQLCCFASGMCEEPDESELGLIIHCLLRLFTDDYGAESFETLRDTHCREKLMSHYEDLSELHESATFHLQARLQEFAQTEISSKFPELPQQIILFLFVEEFTRTLSFDEESFIGKLEDINNIAVIAQDVAAGFNTSVVIAESALRECSAQTGFHYLTWARYSEEIEHAICILKQEGV